MRAPGQTCRCTGVTLRPRAFHEELARVPETTASGERAAHVLSGQPVQERLGAEVRARRDRATELEEPQYAEHPSEVEDRQVDEVAVVDGERVTEGGRGASVFFSSRRRHTRFDCDWSSDVCSSD